jgi:nicotinate-nucleotide adenylyltransferase
MGGTFDPIHNAHLRAANEVAQLLALDEVLLVPAGRPYHRDERTVSTADDRYAMTEIATRENPRLSVSRTEIVRPGPSYTVDTVRQLRASEPGVELFLIVGADALAQIHLWRDPNRLFGLTRVIGCSRVGYRLAEPGVPDVKAEFVDVTEIFMSATMIRQRVGLRASITHLVPDGVACYIRKRGLYKEALQEDDRLQRPRSSFRHDPRRRRPLCSIRYLS